MDAVDPAPMRAARDAIGTVDGVEDVRELRLRWNGPTLRAEADITVPADLPFAEVHDIAHHAEERLLQAPPR